jgi:hypothetical protein
MQKYDWACNTKTYAVPTFRLQWLTFCADTEDSMSVHQIAAYLKNEKNSLAVFLYF